MPPDDPRRHKRAKRRVPVWWAAEPFFKPGYLTRAIELGHHLDVLDCVANPDLPVNALDRAGRAPWHAALLAEDPFTLGALMTVARAADADTDAEAALPAETGAAVAFLAEAPHVHCGLPFLGLPGFHLGLTLPATTSDLARCYVLLLYNRLGGPSGAAADAVDALLRDVAEDVLARLPAPLNPRVLATVDLDCEDHHHMTLLERCAERGDYLLCQILLRAGAALRNSLAWSCSTSSMNVAGASLNTFTLLLHEYARQNAFDRACVMRTLRVGIENQAWPCVSEILKLCDLSTAEFESLADYADALNVSNEWVALVDKSIDGEVSHIEAHSGHSPLGLFTHLGCLDHLPYEPCDFPAKVKMTAVHRENKIRLETLIDPERGLLVCRLPPAPENRLYAWTEVTELAAWADLTRVHDSGYVQFVRESAGLAGEQILTESEIGASQPPLQVDDDSFLTAKSFEAAAAAAHSVIAAIKSVCVQQAHRNAFCCIRPPGHHVGTYGACQMHEGSFRYRSFGSQGFCFFNNVAIGAAWARYNLHDLGIRKIAIVDVDVHHGNGTEAIVRNLLPGPRELSVHGALSHGLALTTTMRVNTDHVWRDLRDAEDVLFCSIHAYDGSFYPGTGEDSVGDGRVLNVAISEAETREEYMDLFERRVIAPLHEFAPDLILVSAGFDGHVMDQVGGARFCKLIEEDYEKMARLLQRVANTCAKGRLVSVLEGGYNVLLGQASPFARSVYAFVRALATTHGSYAAEDPVGEQEPPVAEDAAASEEPPGGAAGAEPQPQPAGDTAAAEQPAPSSDAGAAGPVDLEEGQGEQGSG